MIAVITETGYVSSNDIYYIVNNTRKIAYGISQGVNEYFADR